MTIPQIRQALTFLRDNLKEIKTLLTDLSNDSQKAAESLAKKENKRNNNINTPTTTSSDTFQRLIGSFYDDAFQAYEKFESEFKEAEELYNHTCDLYGEDSKVTSPDEFFGVFYKFLLDYISAKADNDAAYLREREEEKREAAKKV